jgi:hypothetical protein
MTADGSVGRRLKRRLRPLRPVLLPIWRPLRPRLLRLAQAADTVAERAGEWAWAGRRWLDARRGRIRPITRAEFDAVARRFPYYRNRWPYMAAAGREAADLIDRHGLRTALELGPHVRPLIVGADVMVLSASEDLDAEGRSVVHDARERPWPIADGAYDLFVALQVFEHLGDRQPDAFQEVCRVARHAIISLPIDWELDDPTDIHHALTQERVLSWFAPRVPTRIVEGNPGPRRRVLYVFEDIVRTS